MRQFIPYEKLSKRQELEIDMPSRNVWAISPVTRRLKNPKAYNSVFLGVTEEQGEKGFIAEIRTWQKVRLLSMLLLKLLKELDVSDILLT